MNNASLRLVSLIPPGRTCGDCHVCCTSLAVAELRKPKGQRCPHLRCSPAGHCGIYDSRPQSCQVYRCGWLQGFLDDNLRPDVSGILAESLAADDLTILYLDEVQPGAIARRDTAIRQAVQPGVALLCQQGSKISLWSHPQDKARAERLTADLLAGRARVVFRNTVIEPVDGRWVLNQ